MGDWTGSSHHAILYIVSSAPAFPVDPVIEAYKRDVDISLLRENLRRTPEERLLAMTSMLELSAALAAGVRRPRQGE